MEDVRKSFNDLIERGFVINIKDLPKEEHNAIEQSKQTSIFQILLPGKKNPTAPR